MFQQYIKTGVNWERSVITLTFADAVPVPHVEKILKLVVSVMTMCMNWLLALITTVLVERVRVRPEIANNMICKLTKSAHEKMLPYGKQWLVPFWLDITVLY